MKIITDIKKFDKDSYPGPRVVAIGTFDGVHRAHREIIRAAVLRARRSKGTSVVLTFFPHPRQITDPMLKPVLLTGLKHRLQLIAGLHPDVCLVLRFHRAFSLLSPQRFIKQFLIDTVGASGIVVGDNFNFGKNRTGTSAMLKKIGERYDCRVSVIPPVKQGRQVVSSSLIRSFIEQGKLNAAGALLGRPFSIWGTVESGDRRGRRLGFPTANINPHNEAIPPQGVYAVKVRVRGRWYNGMLNIGTNPTFHPGRKSISMEVHLLNFKKNLYGEDVEVLFIRKIRNERIFSSAERLSGQLVLDRRRVERIFAVTPKITGLFTAKGSG